MPAPYRGRVIVVCGLAVCAADKSRADVGVDCLACEHSTQSVVNLDDRPVGYLKKPEAVKTAKKENRRIKEE